MKRKWICIAAAALAGALLASPLSAQSDGRLMGTVTSSDGQPIEDATLVLSDEETGRKIEFSTDRKGKYYRRGIPPAAYELRVSKEGFQEFLGENIRVPAGGEKTLDVTLAPLVTEPVEPIQDASYREGYEALKSGDLETAKTKMEAVLAEAPDDFRPHYVLGHIHLRQGNLDQAKTHLEQARLLKPDASEVYFDLGTVAAREKDWPKAQEYFGRVTELTPQDAEAFYSLGVSYLNENKPAEAAQALGRAVEIKPDHANAHKSMGYALLQEGRYADSVTALERYLELEPQAADRAEIEAILTEIRKNIPAESQPE
ncbi:MAG TPA: tetratricopeptide repeat protein [Acidobacteriota bacterium]